MKEQFEILLQSSQEFLNEMARSIPQIIGAVLILIIGWIVAKIIKKIFIKLLNLVKLNYLTEKTGIEKFLKEGGLTITATQLIGSLIYWIIMLIVIMSSLNTLQLTSAKELFNKIVLYIPNVIIAIVVLLLGIYVARFLSKAISVTLKNMKEQTVNLVEKITYYAIVTLTVFIVLNQLNIGRDILNIAFFSIFGAFCLAAGLAFGLGGKDFAADLLKKLKEKK